MSAPAWQSELANLLPLFGHRNWIAVVDSAYPFQVGGIQTIHTYEEHLHVLEIVKEMIINSIHVLPKIMMDEELNSIKEEKAPGITAAREEILQFCEGYETLLGPHERWIREMHLASSMFACLVLKTKMTLPYTSVFIELQCKYWDDPPEPLLSHSPRVE